MGKRIVARLAFIVRAGNHLPVMHQHRAHRHVAAAFERFFQRHTHEFFVHCIIPFMDYSITTAPKGQGGVIMSNSVLDNISARRSHRAYTAEPVSREQIDLLIKSCLEAPSAINKQPWHITVVQNQELLNELNAEIRAQVMARAENERSPRFADDKFHVFYHAPLVFFLSAEPSWRYSALDSGIAVQNIALAAESLGLGSVILGMPRDAFAGERAAEFEEKLGFLPGEKFMIAIAVGHPADDKPAHPIHEGHITFVD